MNRKLLVTLLQKNIEELSMITDGFMEMSEYPSAIIHLAKRKTEDIRIIIEQLAEIKNATTVTETATPVVEKEIIEKVVQKTEPVIQESVIPEIEVSTIPTEKSIETPEAEVEPAIESIEETQEESTEEISEELTIIQTEDETEITLETSEVTQITEETDNHEIKVTTNETSKTTIVDKIIHPTISRNEVMSKSDNSLSATIANKKISDIKQAISIGDRFRFQRELFKGNGEEMNKTLSYINQLATLDEVLSFLKSKYGWDETNEAAEDFYQIVRRKF